MMSNRIIMTRSSATSILRRRTLARLPLAMAFGGALTYALNLVIIETVLDLKANIVVDEDCMHGVVLAAFKQSYGHIDHTNIDHVLSQLDHITLMKMMKNDRH